MTIAILTLSILTLLVSIAALTMSIKSVIESQITHRAVFKGQFISAVDTGMTEQEMNKILAQSVDGL